MKYLSYLLLMAMLLANGSCDYFSPQMPTIEVLIDADLSGSVDRRCFPTSEEVLQYVLTSIGMSNEDTYYEKGVICYLSYIGEDYRPKITQVVLEPGTLAALDNLAKRRKVVDSFKSNLQRGIERLLTMESRHTSTNLINGLCYQFEVMRESVFASVRKVILITDGFHVSNELNFATYSESPDDVESVAAKFDSICDLGDLSTFDITLLECNSENVAARSATAMWLEQFRKRGATARIRSNLINTIGHDNSEQL